MTAEQDADIARMYAVNCLMYEDNPGAADLPPGGWTEDYARFLIEQEGGDGDRWHAAARQACIDGAEYADLSYPQLWRIALRAVDLCQRAAQIASDASTLA
jgi:hypothetical protein